MKKNIVLVIVGFLLACGSGISYAQPAAVNLPPGVQDVVKLAHAGLSDDVILTQLKANGAFYSLTAEQIICLKDQGVSQTVIKALLGNSGAAAPANTAPAPRPPVPDTSTVPTAPTVAAPTASNPSLDSFRSQLVPYGNWIQVPGYGLCWQPTVAVTDVSWRPYFTSGHWVYSDDGWVWQSDYAWGATVFHYGRWIRVGVGWVWVPGYDYAPAWVCWRQLDGYFGWAPLPPAAVFRVGVGLFFRDRLAVDVDFGLGVDAFTFVAYDHFWDHDLRLFLVPHERAEVLFRDSRVTNGYRVDRGRFFVEGPGHDHIIAMTHRDVRGHGAVRESRPGEDRVMEHSDWHDDKREQHW
jgi:hypothetical protein